MALVKPDAADSLVLNAAMRMLEVCASKDAGLARRGHMLPHFEVACTSARQALEAAALQRARHSAAAQTLLGLEGRGLPCGAGSWRCPRGKVPAVGAVRLEGSGLEEAKRREALCLGTLPLPQDGQQTSSMGFAPMLELLQSPELKRSGDVAVQNALSLV